MKWYVVEIADGNDGFISVLASSTDEAEAIAFAMGYDVLYAHEEE